MPLGRLAMHCVTLPLFGLYLVEDDSMDIAAPERPHGTLTFTSRDECLKQFDESLAKCRAALASASDEHIAATLAFYLGRATNLERIPLTQFSQHVF